MTNLAMILAGMSIENETKTVNGSSFSQSLTGHKNLQRTMCRRGRVGEICRGGRGLICREGAGRGKKKIPA